MGARGPSTRLQYDTPEDLRADVIILRDNQGAYIGLLVMGVLLFVAGVVLYLMSAGRSDLGWPSAKTLLLAIAGPGIATFAAWRLFWMKPRLVLEVAGLHDNRHGYDFIPWTEVVAARVVRDSEDHPYLALRMRHPEWVDVKALDRPSAIGSDEIAISVSLMSRPPNRVLEIVERLLASSRQSAATARQ